MSGEVSNVWNKDRYLEIVYTQFLEVRKRGEATQGIPAIEPFGGELDPGTVCGVMIQADLESFNKWKQTKLV